MKFTRIITLSLVVLTLGGCSLLRRQEAATVNSGDAMPLFPIDIQPADKSIGGHWFVRTVGSITVSGYEDEWPFLEFVPAEGRFYGNNGCNIINGSYRVGEKQTLELSNVAATMRLCQADTLAFPMSQALEKTASYAVTAGGDGTTVLNLYDAQNLPVMTLRKSDIDFINGAWRVASVDGLTVNTAEECRLVFDVAEGTVHGQTGCNLLNGQLTRDSRVGSSLGFSALATTRRACPDQATEQRLLIALEEVNSVRRGDGGSIDLLSANGTPIIHLTPLPKEAIRQ